MSKKTGHVLRVANSDRTIPLWYALKLEAAANALSSLLYDGLTAQSVAKATAANKNLDEASKKLTREQRESLGIWE